MADALYDFFRASLPDELATSLSDELASFEKGDYEEILKQELVQNVFGHTSNEELPESPYSTQENWSDFIFHRLGVLLSKRKDESNQEIKDSPPYRQNCFFLVALASLNAFIQSNVTGPPLPFPSSKLLLPQGISSDRIRISSVRSGLVRSLAVDGEAAYKLTPNVELFCLADLILTSPVITKNVKAARWAKLRVDFLHQRLLSEIAPSLQTAMNESLDTVEKQLTDSNVSPDIYVKFLLERAVIHTHHGFDKKARQDIEQAASQRGFEFALTGRLGKRTKFQQHDVSQLVVLARSQDSAKSTAKGKAPAQSGEQSSASYSGANGTDAKGDVKPINLDLNDDTLLESISFTDELESSTDVKDESSLPEGLKELDPGNQPKLDPLDSIILLSLASSITNTSPAHGLTREETLPYATRVLEGGSSNWQVYTQALLVRSRIEGYKSRTVERGLLQLQALVDQVIAETTSPESTANGEGASTFLPRAKASESAPVTERLLYIFPLNTPSRWELEAELANKWLSFGGLRSALEIYERLEMWAEAALCWAGTDREDKAKKIIRKQLFHATAGKDEDADTDEERWEGAARDPPPADAPRLYCILGDIDKDPSMYEKAWEVSNRRYARAQRLLARYYYALKDHEKAAAAYEAALKVNQLHQPSWFALGCACLELSRFERAKEAFSRAVQLDDTDAESWSNLAAAILHLSDETDGAQAEQTDGSQQQQLENEDSPSTLVRRRDPNSNKQDALKALKRAATLKHTDHRIWDNVLTVSAGVVPPAYTDVLTSLTRIIELRGPSVGEKCIDENILEHLVRYVIVLDTENEGFKPEKPGLERMVVQLVDKKVVPLITTSARLWKLVARLALWRKKPGSALEAQEKAWRAVVSQPGWEYGEEKRWNEVVEATVELCDAYESLGQMEKTEGMAAGSGELVAKDWKFKARSALRGIMGRGKGSWEGTDGWERLKETLEGLRG